MSSSPRDAIPADVVLDIMARLPVKSVMRLRLVSKSFFSDTAAPNFINSHLALSTSSGYAALPAWFDPPSSIAILDKSFFEVLRPEIPFYFSFASPSEFELEFGIKSIYFLVGSCNGVLCFTDNGIDCFGRVVVLWNPMIRKFKKVSDTSLNSSMLYDTTTRITLGLGFDGRNNDHRIVRIVISKYENEPSPQAEIYSLRTHSWRKLIFPINSLSEVLIIQSYKCSFDHGALHWIAEVSGETNIRSDTIIISFKINDEQFKVIKLPEDYARGEATFSLDLMVLKRSLVVAILYETVEAEEKWRVWKMKKYEETEFWTEQVLPITEVSLCYGCTEDGEIILSQDGFDMSFYNLETGTSKEVSFMEDIEYLLPFRESLVLL